jgi:hypothetical protein
MITLNLTQEELQSLAGLLDAGVKATGLASVKTAASMLTKLEAAVAEANAKTAANDEQKEAA